MAEPSPPHVDWYTLATPALHDARISVNMKELKRPTDSDKTSVPVATQGDVNDKLLRREKLADVARRGRVGSRWRAPGRSVDGVGRLGNGRGDAVPLHGTCQNMCHTAEDDAYSPEPDAVKDNV